MNHSSHCLDIILVSSPSPEIEERIRRDIMEIIHGKIKSYFYSTPFIQGVTITLQWNKDDPTVPQGSYSTDVEGMYGDVAVQLHKESLLKEVLGVLNPKFDHIFAQGKTVLVFRVTKYLTRTVPLV